MSVLCRVCHVFPPHVSIFGLFPVLVSCHYELICVQLCVCDCVNYPVYISPVFWVWFRLVYLLLPRCILSLCLVLSCLDIYIKDYYLSLYPHLCVPVPPSCVHRDRRPDPTVSGAPSPRFVLFVVWKVFILFLSVCPAAWKSPLVIPAIAHCKSAWEFGGIAASAASPLVASSVRSAGWGYPKPAGWLSGSRVAAPPGAPFAGDHATGSPLTQCPPARLWLKARRIAADSKPAGSPLTQARRIAADSCPPDWHWLMPAGRRNP